MKNNYDEYYEYYEYVSQKPFYKDKFFWIGFAGTVALYIIFTGLSLLDKSSYIFIYALMGVLVYPIIGIAVFLGINKKNKRLASGIFLGSIAPFIVVFAATGGCGLLR